MCVLTMAGFGWSQQLSTCSESSRMAGKVTSGYFMMKKLLDAILLCIYAELKLSLMTVAGASADGLHAQLFGWLTSLTTQVSSVIM